jgi:pimeloyl-ACP methyl ester carboxylesterase
VTTRALLALGAVVLLTAACGSGSGPSAASSSSAPGGSSTSSAAGPLAAWPCLANVPATAAVVPGTPELTVALVGTGPRVVILSNQSDEDLCSWLPLAQRLVGRGLEVALYDYVTSPRADLGRAITYVRSHGATAVSLLGASEGAKTSIVEGATLRPPVQSVVSLSAEEALQGVAVAPYAAKLRVPTLFLTAAQDAYGSTSATKAYYRTAAARTKRLVVVPGTAHGTALLNSASVTAAVLNFVDAHDR